VLDDTKDEAIEKKVALVGNTQAQLDFK